MTSAAERACALVGNMLACGPRDAAEILAAAEGAKISRRTIQRSAAVLGVVKVKEGLAAGWSWRLEPKRPAASGTVAPIDPARAETIAARLRKLEAGRGKVAPIYAGDPRVKQWADSGISDPDLREASLLVFLLVAMLNLLVRCFVVRARSVLLHLPGPLA